MDILQRHRTSLFNKFTKEYIEFDRELKAELAKNTSQASAERDDLFNENTRLRAELAALRESLGGKDNEVHSKGTTHGTGTRSDPSSERPAPHTTPVNSSALCQNCNELEIKYSQLHERYWTLNEAHGKLSSRYRNEKDTIKAWIRYLEKYHAHEWSKRKKTEVEAGEHLIPTHVEAQPGPLSWTPPSTRGDNLNSSETPVPAGRRAGGSFNLDTETLPEERTTDDVGAARKRPLPERDSSGRTLRRDNSTSSETAKDVFQRNMKRRRLLRPASVNSDRETVVASDSATHTVLLIKDEPISSSPIGLVGLFNPEADSIDLDEVGEIVRTPKKKRQFHTTLRPVSSHKGSSQTVSPTPSEPSTEYGHHSDAEIDSIIKAETNSMAALDFPEASLRLRSTKRVTNTSAEISKRSLSITSSALQPKNSNLRARNKPHAAHLTGIVKTEKGNVSEFVKKVTKDQIGDTLPGTSGASERNTRSSQDIEASTTGPGLVPAPRSANAKTSIRLRDRVFDDLSLDDFKINPVRNQGIDYAFVDSVRKKELRKCLPGCTAPNCCGDIFRKAVELGGVVARPSSLAVNSSQHDQDQALLEDYLGDEKHVLSTMSVEDRGRLLVKAQAKQFADQHGKHRQAHERRTTPPGFWRTEMPNTQENEVDRAEARTMERAKIEERFREAMRPHGKWKFRDE